MLVLWAAAGLVAMGAGQPVDPWRERAEAAVARVDAANARGPWKPEMAALAAHEEAPEWFLDAKFGIYFHWGVYSVPAFDNEWYPRNMHIAGSAANTHHAATFGDPARFGYHDFVPRFTAERFDTGEWAALFQEAGARFAGPVAEHHDGFAMWGSGLTPWNAAEAGPKRDVTGELAGAIRGRGMKFIATFHHGFNGQRTEDEARATGYYTPREGWPTSSEDPRLRLLYGNLPRAWSQDLWLGKLQEVIDGYRPDLIWFDSCLHRLPPGVQAKFLAYYFNRAAEWGAAEGTGPRPVVVTCKNHDLSPDIAVEDFEKGRSDRLTARPWLTDDTISRGSWCYTEDLTIKPAAEVIRVLADIVSKNGVLLLNISPKADGTIPADQQEVLRGIGGWLRENGAAIYGTRPWQVYGEGPTRMAKGGHFVGDVEYGAEDIRYTRSKDGASLYAIVLGEPAGEVVTLRSVTARAGATGMAEILGPVAERTRWWLNDSGQVVLSWPGMRDAPAYVVKLPAAGLAVHEEALVARDPDLLLLPARALLDGGLHVEERGGEANIGFWDRATDSAHWLVRVERPGVYRVLVKAAAEKDSGLALSLDGQRARGEIAATGGWDSFRTCGLGEIRFDAAGVQHVVLSPADPGAWAAVNVRWVALVPRD